MPFLQIFGNWYYFSLCHSDTHIINKNEKNFDFRWFADTVLLASYSFADDP